LSVIPKKYRDCYSIESRAAHGADDREIEQVEAYVIGNMRYIIYQDSEGQYWYKTQIKKGTRYVDMEEAIFGKNVPRRYYRHKA